MDSPQQQPQPSYFHVALAPALMQPTLILPHAQEFAHQHMMKAAATLPPQAQPTFPQYTNKMALIQQSLQQHQQHQQQLMQQQSQVSLSQPVSLPQTPQGIQQGIQRLSMQSDGSPHPLESYELLKTLGSGAFGKVLLIRCRRSDKKFALKVLEKRKVVKMKQVEHTLNERNILGQIDFPFIVNMTNSFKDQRNLYMVLECVPGGELFTHLRKEDHFTESRLKFYAAQVILALEYLHQKHIIHRDVKPENLLMDARGYLKLADFGFAKYVEDKTWTMCGTPEYTAPEVIKRKGHNKSVDWWAIGVLMYEMGCGFTPFEVAQRDRMKMYAKILKGAIRYPRHFSENLASICGGLLEVDTTKRFGCMVNGVKDIKGHPFFAGFDWSALYWKTVPAPFVPVIRSATDVSNFDQCEETVPQVKVTTSWECPVDFPGF